MSDLLVWAAWLAVCVLFAVFVPIWWERKREIPVRTPEALTLQGALSDWLQQERICRALIETGSIGPRQLRFTSEVLPWMTEYQMRQAAATILRDRMVRRVIAIHMEKHTDKATVQAALRLWSVAA